MAGVLESDCSYQERMFVKLCTPVPSMRLGSYFSCCQCHAFMVDRKTPSAMSAIEPIELSNEGE